MFDLSTQTCMTVADPGGAAGARPPHTGPDSFVLTYKFFKM